MNEDPSPVPDTPRKPLIVPPQPRRAPAQPFTAAPVAVRAPRLMATPGASPPAPGAVVRSLLATKGWALICAWVFMLFGILTVVRSTSEWRKLSMSLKTGIIEPGTAGALILRLELIFSFALAAGCLYVAPRLFRYAGAITRLRAANRMHELEKALRHQQAVWFVLGTIGALWLTLFAFQIVNVVMLSSGTEEETMDADAELTE